MKKIMAANWKMYKTAAQARDTARGLAQALEGKLPSDREVVVFPPFTAIAAVAEELQGKIGLHVGGQDLYPAEEGAYTGEISSAMLLDLGCTFALAGHSERRHVLGESNAFVGEKAAYGVSAGLNVVLCIGETLEQREEGGLEDVLEEQLLVGLSGLPKDLGQGRLFVAYEPVWAIGTGKVAGPAEILEAHGIVRQKLMEFMPGVGAVTPILYGGSVKAENCAEIIGLDNVDGVLVGGASLQFESFSRIVLA